MLADGEICNVYIVTSTRVTVLPWALVREGRTETIQVHPGKFNPTYYCVFTNSDPGAHTRYQLQCF